MRNLSEQQITRICTIILAVWGLLLVISIPYQRPHIDEAWLGEQAYFFAHDGVIRSEMFQGYAHQEERILITHKLFIACGGLSVRLFGWGLVQLRLVSLICGILLLVLITRHIRGSQADRSLLASRIAPLGLIAMPLFFKFMNYYRPEVMLAAFGFLSYHLLSLYLDNNHKWNLIGAGLVAGVAALVHLNGIIFILAGVAVLSVNRRFRAGGGFAIIATAVTMLYFVDVLGHWDLFRQQLAAVPSLQPEDYRWDAPFWRLLDEHKRLFRKPEIIFTTSLFLGGFAYLWYHMRHARRRLLTYTAAAIVGLGAIGQAKTTPYAIALFPLFALVIGRATAHWLLHYKSTNTRVSVTAFTLWAAFMLHSFAADALIAATEKVDIVRINRQTASTIEPVTTVLAPMEFIFNEIDNYKVRAVMAADLRAERAPRSALTVGDLRTYADSTDIEAIILDREYRDHMGLTDASIGSLHDGFRVAAHLRDIGRVVLTRDHGVIH